MKNYVLLLGLIFLNLNTQFAQNYKLKTHSEPYQKLTNAIQYTDSLIWVAPLFKVEEDFNFLDKEVEFIQFVGGYVVFSFFDESDVVFNTNMGSCKDINLINFPDESNYGTPGSGSKLSYKFIENDTNKILVLQSDSVGFLAESTQGSGQYYSCQTWIYESGHVEVKIGSSKVTDTVMNLGVSNSIIFRYQGNTRTFYIRDYLTSFSLIKTGSEVGVESFFKRFPEENTVFEYYLGYPLSNTNSIVKALSISTLVTHSIQISNNTEPLQYSIYALSGGVLKSGVLNSNQIEVEELAAGSYILQCKLSNGESSNFKFVKL